MIIGKTNKELIIKDMIEKLNFDENTSNIIYNTVMDIIKDVLK